MKLNNYIKKSLGWIGSVVIAAGVGYWYGRDREAQEQRAAREEEVPRCAPGRSAVDAGRSVTIHGGGPPEPPAPPSGAAAAVTAQARSTGQTIHAIKQLDDEEVRTLRRLQEERR